MFSGMTEYGDAVLLLNGENLSRLSCVSSGDVSTITCKGGNTLEYCRVNSREAIRLESTGVINKCYLEDGSLHLEKMGRGYAWLDTGTHESLVEASTFIQTIETRQGLRVCCPEEIAYFNGWIDAERLRQLAAPLAKNGYGQYLLGLIGQDRIG